MDNDTVLEMLTLTAETFGQNISPRALLLMEQDLSIYDPEKVVYAIDRCRKECSKLSIAEVIKRIEETDGRPSPNEAWNVALSADDEFETVVWNNEISEAWGAAYELSQSGDKTGARMAFIEAYKRICQQAREGNKKPVWNVSIGEDKARAADVIKDAVERKRLTQAQAQLYLPSPVVPMPGNIKRLTSNVASIKRDREFSKNWIKRIKAENNFAD